VYKPANIAFPNTGDLLSLPSGVLKKNSENTLINYHIKVKNNCTKPTQDEKDSENTLIYFQTKVKSFSGH